VNGFRQEDVQRAADELVRLADFGKHRAPEESERRGDFVTPMQIDPAELSVQEKLDRCRELHRRVQGRDPRIINVLVRYLELSEHAVYASQSADLAQRIQRLNLHLFVVVAGEDGRIQ